MEDESLDFAEMEQLKQLAPHLYTGVKERLLVETVVAAWEQYTEHLRDETPHKEFDDETRVTLDECHACIERIQKFYQDNPPT